MGLGSWAGEDEARESDGGRGCGGDGQSDGVFCFEGVAMGL